MLNIPSEVKALFKRDDIYKNFHVHFPNGEFRDLNNEDIVTESVKFTESLCSQQYLKFGLTEASEIRFECYGVPNIRGALIQCVMEIDCSSLGNAWLTDHDDPSAGFLEPHAVMVTTGLGYYSIPYGQFMVDSCPRNHQQRARREVTAFTHFFSANDDFSPFEVYKLSEHRTKKKTTLNVSDLVATALNYIPNEYSLKSNLKSKYSQRTGNSYEHVVWLGDGTSENKFSLFMRRDVYYSASLSKTDRDSNSLVKVTFDRNTVTLFDEFAEQCEACGITGYYKYLPFYDTDLPDALILATPKQILNTRNPKEYLGLCVNFPDALNAQQYEGFSTLDDTIFSLRDAYAQSNGFLFGTGYITKEISVMLRTGHGDYPSQGTLVWEGYYNLFDDFTLNGYDITTRNELQKMTMTFDHTLEIPDKPRKPIMTYYNAYSLTDIVNGYFEIKGVFLKQGRDNSISEFALPDSETESIQRSQYSSVWYEDDQIQPIGMIKYRFVDQKSDKDNEYSFDVSDGSIYDMTDNYVLQHLNRSGENDKTTAAKIESALDSGFRANVPVFSFVPSKVEMQALPYVEAGDTIESVTEDSETVDTMIFERTITGIQCLKDDISSAGGEAVGNA